ncbi:MAG: hypothetical protein ISR64_04820 [Deltaproteobacteria bacterium]|nr:hypothetical protein [Deltaproteobacteria bacterium]
MSTFWLGLLASTLAGLAMGVGALPALFFKNVPDKILDTMLSGAAGVMLAATSFSLIVPGIEYGDRLWPGMGVCVIVAGMLIGAYRGCLEVTQDIAGIRGIEGEKRLLDWDG